MIIYLKHEEIDRDLWDSCIHNTPGAKPYAYSWYLDMMAPGWQALVDDDYNSVFPIPGFSRFGIKYIATPVFLQQLGVFSPDKQPSESIMEFIEFIPDCFKLIDLCIGQKIEYPGYTVIGKKNCEVDLSPDYDTLHNNYTSNCRRNIKISLKKKPKVTTSVKPSELIDLFIKNKGKKITGIKKRDYQRLENLMNYCISTKKGRIIGARESGRGLIYGVFIVEYEEFRSILFVANTTRSRERRIGYFIMDELIKANASTNAILDFAGSSIPSVAEFDESFGTREVPYYRIYKNNLFWPVRLLK